MLLFPQVCLSQQHVARGLVHDQLVVISLVPRVSPTPVINRLLPREHGPALAALSDQELSVLRAPLLDRALLTCVAGHYVPNDLLLDGAGRARALAPLVPTDSTVIGAAALWVHAGGDPPAVLTVSTPSRHGSRTALTISRASLPHQDTVVLAGLRCATLARAAVDVARTAAPLEAVQALLTAYRLGADRVSLYLALSHCHGASHQGRPRAHRLIAAVGP